MHLLPPPKQKEILTYPCIGRLCVSICDVTSWMFIGRPKNTNTMNLKIFTEAANFKKLFILAGQRT